MSLWLVVVCLTLSNVFAQQLDLLEAIGDDCINDIDLMIVLDGSFSVGTDNFEVVKDWVKSVAKGMQIELGNVQIGVVQYSHYYPNRPLNRQRFLKTEIQLGEYKNMKKFNAAVDRIRYQGYKTYTAHALNKTLNVDFVSRYNRYPEAKRALILLTDGRATDSNDLPPVIERAESEFGVVMYAVGVGQFDEAELQLITHNHTSRVFKLANFKDLNQIVTNLQLQLQETCDCDAFGTLNDECDPCTRQCVCKPNVVGRRCDDCAELHYGFGNTEGCIACACNPLGSSNQDCDRESGQCSCLPNVQGRDCSSCDAGFFGFPACQPCGCNGYSEICDEFTGVCIACLEGRRGDHCEICPTGHFLDEESKACVPCMCNGNVDLNDPDACNPVTGVCEKCLHNTAGTSCDKCAKFYYGDALMQKCTRCQCHTMGTDLSSCVGDACTCSDSGACACLSNVEGDSCDRCSPGTWKITAGNGCITCGCSSAGSQENTTCDEDTGACVCKEQYTGLKCGDCSEGFQESENGECVPPLSDLYGDEPEFPEPTTTKPPTTTQSKKKPIRVNPGWSPCVSCGGQKWPSYCRGWMCRRRWPYSQQRPSSRRCYSWNWGCRSSVENYGYQQSYYQPSYQRSNYYKRSYNRQPTYYRGYNHHARSFRPRQGYRAPMRYNIYRH